MLLNFLDTDLYERQGKAITNFKLALPAPQSGLAQEMTKDPYNFDFLAIAEDYREKELKDALEDNIRKWVIYRKILILFMIYYFCIEYMLSVN